MSFEPLKEHEWDEYWNEQIQCVILGVNLDLRKRIVTLMLSDTGCTDMQGAIDYARSFMPKVTRIETIAGDTPDTTYILRAKGWISVTPSGAAMDCIRLV
jgi:hypothetical protein